MMYAIKREEHEMTANKQFHPINVSPFGTNVLDLIGRTDLVTHQGYPISIQFGSYGTGFATKLIRDNGEINNIFNSNLDVSYYLNGLEIGII
jgi:hypothetical protein